eukprot:1182228-Rhodomonas_salina.2
MGRRGDLVCSLVADSRAEGDTRVVGSLARVCRPCRLHQQRWRAALRPQTRQEQTAGAEQTEDVIRKRESMS